MTVYQLEAAAFAWAHGHNTVEIARRLQLKEAVIANLIECIRREAKRQCQHLQSVPKK